MSDQPIPLPDDSLPDKTFVPHWSPRPGALIVDRYKLLEQIGEGGMGSVWVAEQLKPLRRRVALKLVKAGMDSREVIARFDAERQALALMDHPNIARVFDGGLTEQGRPYFAMEYVKGSPITTYCDDAKLPLKGRLQLFVAVCHAVQHAHQKGVIHRDLKPSNILVCLYDGAPVPKVIDFGLAKATQQQLTEHTLYTAHGMMVGTPLYMSPEQAESNNWDIDTRSDVYSLGVLLYEILTGSTPLEAQQFKKAAFQEILRLIRDFEPPRPSMRLSGSQELPVVAAQRGIDPRELKRTLSGELDWIVMKALEKERNRRYDTANGLARDIDRYLNEEVVEARPPSLAYRFSKTLRRYRTQALVVATAIMLLVGSIIGTTWGLLRAIDANQRAVAANDRLQSALDEVQRQEAARKDAEDLAQREQQTGAAALQQAERAEVDKKLATVDKERENTIRRFRDVWRRVVASARSYDSYIESTHWLALKHFVDDTRDNVELLEHAFEDHSEAATVVSHLQEFCDCWPFALHSTRRRAFEILDIMQQRNNALAEMHVAEYLLSHYLGRHQSLPIEYLTGDHFNALISKRYDSPHDFLSTGHYSPRMVFLPPYHDEASLSLLTHTFRNIGSVGSHVQNHLEDRLRIASLLRHRADGEVALLLDRWRTDRRNVDLGERDTQSSLPELAAMRAYLLKIDAFLPYVSDKTIEAIAQRVLEEPNTRFAEQSVMEIASHLGPRLSASTRRAIADRAAEWLTAEFAGTTLWQERDPNNRENTVKPVCDKLGSLITDHASLEVLTRLVESVVTHAEVATEAPHGLDVIASLLERHDGLKWDSSPALTLRDCFADSAARCSHESRDLWIARLVKIVERGDDPSRTLIATELLAQIDEHRQSPAVARLFLDHLQRCDTPVMSAMPDSTFLSMGLIPQGNTAFASRYDDSLLQRIIQSCYREARVLDMASQEEMPRLRDAFRRMDSIRFRAMLPSVFLVARLVHTIEPNSKADLYVDVYLSQYRDHLLATESIRRQPPSVGPWEDVPPLSALGRTEGRFVSCVHAILGERISRTNDEGFRHAAAELLRLSKQTSQNHLLLREIVS